MAEPLMRKEVDLSGYGTSGDAMKQRYAAVVAAEDPRACLWTDTYPNVVSATPGRHLERPVSRFPTDQCSGVPSEMFDPAMNAAALWAQNVCDASMMRSPSVVSSNRSAIESLSWYVGRASAWPPPPGANNFNMPTNEMMAAANLANYSPAAWPMGAVAGPGGMYHQPTAATPVYQSMYQANAMGQMYPANAYQKDMSFRTGNDPWGSRMMTEAVIDPWTRTVCETYVDAVNRQPFMQQQQQTQQSSSSTMSGQCLRSGEAPSSSNSVTAVQHAPQEQVTNKPPMSSPRKRQLPVSSLEIDQRSSSARSSQQLQSTAGSGVGTTFQDPSYGQFNNPVNPVSSLRHAEQQNRLTMTAPTAPEPSGRSLSRADRSYRTETSGETRSRQIIDQTMTSPGMSSCPEAASLPYNRVTGGNSVHQSSSRLDAFRHLAPGAVMTSLATNGNCFLDMAPSTEPKQPKSEQCTMGPTTEDAIGKLAIVDGLRTQGKQLIEGKPTVGQRPVYSETSPIDNNGIPTTDNDCTLAIRNNLVSDQNSTLLSFDTSEDPQYDGRSSQLELALTLRLDGKPSEKDVRLCENELPDSLLCVSLPPDAALWCESQISDASQCDSRLTDGVWLNSNLTADADETASRSCLSQLSNADHCNVAQSSCDVSRGVVDQPADIKQLNVVLTTCATKLDDGQDTTICEMPLESSIASTSCIKAAAASSSDDQVRDCLPSTVANEMASTKTSSSDVSSMSCVYLTTVITDKNTTDVNKQSELKVSLDDQTNPTRSKTEKDLSCTRRPSNSAKELVNVTLPDLSTTTVSKNVSHHGGSEMRPANNTNGSNVSRWIDMVTTAVRTRQCGGATSGPSSHSGSSQEDIASYIRSSYRITADASAQLSRRIRTSCRKAVELGLLKNRRDLYYCTDVCRVGRVEDDVPRTTGSPLPTGTSATVEAAEIEVS